MRSGAMRYSSNVKTGRLVVAALASGLTTISNTQAKTKTCMISIWQGTNVAARGRSGPIHEEARTPRPRVQAERVRADEASALHSGASCIGPGGRWGQRTVRAPLRLRFAAD